MPPDLMARIEFGALASSTTPNDISAGPGLAYFFSDPYQEHNRARLAHLASLGLPLSNRRVLELGSGPGDHTGFFVERNCSVVAVDSRQDCLDILKQRYPDVQTVRCDLNAPEALLELGAFDVIHCYGILYHLETPGALIRYMGEACTGFAIVETCVLGEEGARVEIVSETPGDYTQSSTGRGSRPTRTWVFDELRRHFPFVYHTRTQPNHPEFPIDWDDLAGAPPLTRAIFAASKGPLEFASLSPTLLNVQERLDRTAYIATLEAMLAANRSILQERERLIQRLHNEAQDFRGEAARTASAAGEELAAARQIAAAFRAAAEERLAALLQKERAIADLDAACAMLRAEVRELQERSDALEAAAHERLEAMTEKDQLIATLDAELKRRVAKRAIYNLPWNSAARLRKAGR